MKRIATQFTYPAALAAAAVLLAFIVLANAAPTRAAAPEPGMTTAGKAPQADHAEARIKELHTKLKITPEQEELWNNVAQVDAGRMRKRWRRSSRQGQKKQATMNAVDDLKSYGEIADAHADGIKKFIPVFEPLYASMSDAQKKNADTLFRHRIGTKAKTKAKAKGK